MVFLIFGVCYSNFQLDNEPLVDVFLIYYIL